MIPQQVVSPSRKQMFTYEVCATGNKSIDNLLRAVSNDKIGDIEKFLKENPTINCCSKNGITPLMIAAYKGEPRVFELILEKSTKENINAVDATGRNALHYACASQHFKRVELLYKEHKLAITKDSRGYCAAEYADSIAKEVFNLMGKDTQDFLDREGLFLLQVYAKAGGDVAKMNALMKEYGLTGSFKVSTIDEFKGKYGDSVKKVSSQTLQKIKQKQKKLMKADQLEIAEHFIANPPQSVREAIGYVWEKYCFKSSEASMQKLLDYADTKRKEREEAKKSATP